MARQRAAAATLWAADTPATFVDRHTNHKRSLPFFRCQHRNGEILFIRRRLSITRTGNFYRGQFRERFSRSFDKAGAHVVNPFCD
jgi:hypothetical protein